MTDETKTRKFEINPKENQSFETRLIELAVAFTKEQSMKRHTNEIGYRVKISEIDFLPYLRVEITREYICLGLHKDKYSLETLGGEGYLYYNQDWRSSSDVCFQDDLIKHMEQGE